MRHPLLRRAITLLASLTLGCLPSLSAAPAVAVMPAPSPALSLGTTERSPLNQVFQFSASGDCTAWPDGSKSQGTLYLWVPETCRKLRGIVILATNVPEHMLANHTAIRCACAENDLGLIWSVHTFWNFAKIAKGHDDIQVSFFQQLLDSLAEKSGYREVATVPWLPIGESGHLLMVAGMIQQHPERCIAGICAKNPHPVNDKSVPLLWTLGTAQEWTQSKGDIRASWLNTGNYPGWIADRAKTDWPLSMLVEAGTGHFYCTDAMAEYFGKYITAAAKARLSDDGSPTLKPLKLESGVLAHLPLNGQTDLSVIPYAQAAPEQRNRAWFFNADLAREAQRLSTANWNAAPQFVGFVAGEGCRTEPFALNSVTKLFVQGDGTFSIRAELFDKIPEGFVAAGEPLARAPGEPIIEWICGPVAPLGNGKFKIALDRLWGAGGACYLIGRHEGDAQTRRTVQPLHVTLTPNSEGTPQTITFDPIADVKVGTKTLPLSARSDANLPVEYFVVSGPAVIRDGKLEFTPVPPSAKLPLEVTVAAWQWGRASEPKVRTAAIVRQTFHLVP
jgi:hypothetical protein